MWKLLLISVFIVFASKECYGYSFSFGRCPEVDPVPGFEINRMLGIWYVIQKNSMAYSCLHFDFGKQSNGQYQLTKWRPHSRLTATALYHEHQTTGKISIPDSYLPGRMTVDFPFNEERSKFTVFMTDYNHYAVVMECKEITEGHQWQVSVLSRSRRMSQWQLDEIKRRLPSYNVDPFALSNVNQQNCPVPVRQKSLEGEVVVGVMNKI